MALTTGNIITYASNTWPWAEIATAPDGSFYAIMDNNNAERGIAIVKYNTVTQTWDDFASFDPTDAGVDSFSDDLDIAISSDGHLHVVFKHSINPGVTSTRGVMYGEYDGTDWTFQAIEQVSTSNGGKNMDNPRVIVDSSDNVHITYEYSEYIDGSTPRTYAIRYATDAGGSNFAVETPFSWSGMTDSGINEIHDPVVLEGPSGKIHLLYRYEDNFNGSGNLYYMERASNGTWQATPTLVDGTPGAGNPNYYAYFATDENDAVQVFSLEPNASNEYQLNIISNATGSFVSTPELTEIADMWNVSGYQIVNGSEYIHVTETTNSSTGETAAYIYARTVGGTDWTKVADVGSGGADTDFAINSSGEFMVILSDQLGSGSGGSGNSVTFEAGLAAPLDTTPPATPAAPDLAAASDTGSSATDNITNDTTPTFSGTTEALATVKVYAGGTTLIGTTTADGSGNWSVTSSVLAQGTHNITVTATDAAGNVSLASSALAITVDTTQPVVFGPPDLAAASDTGASTTDNITRDTTPTFTGLAEANATIELFRGGTTSLGTTTADGAGNWSFTASALPNGSHSITAVATDMVINCFVLSATIVGAKSSGTSSSSSGTRSMTV